MKSLYSGGVCVAIVSALNMAVFAQTTASQQPATASAAQAGEQQVTVTGCIQREADYRRAKDAGRGGVAGSGVGAGNEFVLANASMGAAGTAGTSGATAETPTGTAGAGPTGTAYELSGAKEGEAAAHVGRRVEISGKLKAAEVAPSGRPTGGATAGRPPEGIEVAGQDLKLRELEIESIRQVSGTCPAQ
jgi:hypothetical protein